MRLPHRLRGQKVKSQGHGAGAYCGGHLAAQLVIVTRITNTQTQKKTHKARENTKEDIKIRFSKYTK